MFICHYLSAFFFSFFLYQSKLEKKGEMLIPFLRPFFIKRYFMPVSRPSTFHWFFFLLVHRLFVCLDIIHSFVCLLLPSVFFPPSFLIILLGFLCLRLFLLMVLLSIGSPLLLLLSSAHLNGTDVIVSLRILTGSRGVFTSGLFCMFHSVRRDKKGMRC